MRSSSVGTLALLVALITAGSARADGNYTVEAADTEPDPRTESDADRLRFGGVFGVGFPRLLAIEGLFKVGRYAALGIEYSQFPEFAVSDVSLAIWALAGDVRVFPFGNGFFVGLRGGHQQLDAETTLVVQDEEITLAGGLGTVFLNPRLGFLWTWDSGITFGLDAGLQIPISARTSGALALADSVMLPPGAGERTVSQVRRIARTFGETTLPTIDLLRLGLLL
jgi:hypothetical protein